MKLKQKRQILDIFGTIEEGINYAYSVKEDGPKATRMLEDCNDGLTYLANTLIDEKSIYHALHETKNLIYSIIFQINDSLFFTTSKLNLYRLLNEVKRLIQDDIVTELEIAFMPYKASMWDSMESIYREVVKDPNCSCYVVPIPYYEKDSKGEPVAYCYEGNGLPSDVNITLFEMYDFENRQPDIIYIHNPFDEYNTLTMINPRFFSHNLAKYTDMLVYVPYYVAGSAEGKTFNVMPAMNHVTKIIAQSQASKDSYVASGISADKVLNIGSPKLDAMLNAVNSEKNIEIPYFWNDRIGENKVILLSMGIADLLSINTWIEQLELTFETIKSTKDCTFIWRPHPLTEITLKTMRPHLHNRYKKLISEVKKTRNIILDTSEDIYPSVMVSDALISDYSSVMLQYILTQKPVMALLEENMTQANRYYLSDYLGCYLPKELSLTEFIKMVKSDNDPKREERLTKFKNSVSNPDGTCGERIHYAIKTELVSRSS